MTREEWYNSPKFVKLRLLNNLVHELIHKNQQVRDLLAVIDADYGPLVGDRFSLVERQQRIVALEVDKLVGYASRMTDSLSPHTFDDFPQGQGGQPCSTATSDGT